MERITKDAICKCGHKQSQHNDTLSQECHRDCVKCDCSQFTWVAWGEEIPASTPKEKLKALEGKKVFLITKLGNFKGVVYEIRGNSIQFEKGSMAISQIEEVRSVKNERDL